MPSSSVTVTATVLKKKNHFSNFLIFVILINLDFSINAEKTQDCVYSFYIKLRYVQWRRKVRRNKMPKSPLRLWIFSEIKK